MREAAKEKILPSINVVHRIFHDPMISRPMAIRAAQELLDHTTDPAARYELLSQIIYVGGHLDCLAMTFKKADAEHELPQEFREFLQTFFDHL